MNKILCALVVLILIGCSHSHKSDKKGTAIKITAKKVADNNSVSKPIIQYSDQQLEGFLDSVGRLPTQPLVDKAAFGADSIFKSPRQLDTLISSPDIKILKYAVHKGVIAVKTAQRIFNSNQISYSGNIKSVLLTYGTGVIPILYYPFNPSNGEYGICIGDPEHCPTANLYFFKGNKVIAMHNFYTRFEAGLHHYKDSDGKTIVYYVYMFTEGSNEWWFNYFFYKYDGNKLIPVLNQLKSGNVTMQLAARSLWFQTEVQKTNPLTFKMVYYDQFPDTGINDFGPKLINDSTIIRYKWDNHLKILQGEYEKSKITQPQILSYYLPGDNTIFINSHYKSLKKALLDKTKKKTRPKLS